LPAEVKVRLMALAGNRITQGGVLVLDARQHRTQEQNREAAVSRLVDLVRRAVEPPRPRHRTRPSHASVQRRLEGKHQHGAVKRMRRWSPTGEE
jgi:ribosome-associated protein